MVSSAFLSQWNKFSGKSKKYKIHFVVTLIILIVSFAYVKPQKFADLWLTRDQQGQVLFLFGKYHKASQQFDNTRWKAFSAYGAEEYEQSALLYGQYNNVEDLLGRANALAHRRDYVKARALYIHILELHSDNNAAKTNLAIVQAIIDEINLLSESQQAEQGESIKELGDEPQSGDGAEREDGKKQAVEQFTSEQLLMDPKLNSMWLRQVQKNPARFLSQKFYMQLENGQTSNKGISKVVEGGEND